MPQSEFDELLGQTLRKHAEAWAQRDEPGLIAWLKEAQEQERQRYRMEHPFRSRFQKLTGWLRWKRRFIHNWHDRYCQRMGWTQ